MSGDYSRTRFQPGKHYQGVLRQQGRVDLDADWNEYVDLQDRRWRAESIDIMGRSGVSSETPNAFQVKNLASQLAVGPGRIYVDGYVAENHGGALQFNPVLEEQYGTSFLPVAAFPTGPSLVYLDVWCREVTHLQDPELIEPAVNVETTTRYQTAWQVRVLPLAATGSINCQTPLADVPGWPARHLPSTARLTTTTVATAPEADPCLIAPTGGYRGLENHLYRVEVHEVTGTEVRLKWSRENGSVACAVLNVEHAGTTTTLQVDSLGRDEILSFKNGNWVEIRADRDEFDGGAGVMRQVTVNPDTNQLIVTPPLDSVLFPNGQVAADKHVRAIRWDQSGSGLTNEGLITVTAAKPSFVLEYGIQSTLDGLNGARVGDHWCFAARTAESDIERLEQAPPHGVHHFCKLAIVEADGTIQDCRAQFPALTQLTSLFYVSGDGQEASAGTSVPQPLQVGVARGQGRVAGATVRFATQIGEGTLQGSGKTLVDVVTGPDGVASCTWTLGTAAASQQVLARLLDATGTPIHLPVRFNATIGLSGLDAGVHVKRVTLASGVPLENDTSVPANRFAEGLVIDCDAAIERDTVLNRPTCVVALDLPYPLTESDTKLWESPIFGYQQIRLAAETDTNNNAITWSPTKDAMSWLAERLFTVLAKQQLEAKVLAHLVLLGNFVWQDGKPEVWVDGDLFGMREKPDEAVPTVGRWPTGDGRRGGNLHVWFWLTPPEKVNIVFDPDGATVSGGGQRDFTISVTGTQNRALKFDPIDPGSGEIEPAKGNDGVWRYTAPGSVLARRTVSITAQSVADPNVRRTTLVHLVPGTTKPPTGITIEPVEAELEAGDRQDFLIRADGAADPTLNVSLDPPALGALTLVNKNEGRWTYEAPDKVPEAVTDTIVASSPKAPNDPVKAVVSLRPARGPQPPPRSSGSPTKKSVSRTKAPGGRKGSKSGE
jgi:hypothetical protein